MKITAKRHVTKHPTEKPERLLDRIIALGCKEGDLVLDPFMGSGTTGVVCKKQRRNFVGIEIDSNFCNISKKRIEETTAQQDMDFASKKEIGLGRLDLSVIT